MKKIIMYSTCELFTKHQTGGTKRFLELLSFFCSNGRVELYSSDDEKKIKKQTNNIDFIQMNKSRDGVLPPEIRLGFANISKIKSIKDSKYDRIISFDVPPTLFLCLFHIKNIVLMVRKDFLGYETIIGKNSSTKSKVRLFLLKMCERYVLKRVSLIIVQCEYDKEQLIKRHPILKSEINTKCRVQINNVNPSWIENKSSVEKLQFNNNCFNIGFIGDFDNRRKGHDIFLPAIKELQKKGYSVVAHVMGGGRTLEKYKQQYEDSTTIFYGRVDNPIAILKSCDLIVVPSMADSCPNTVMEALYNGVVVIGSNVGGIPEILQDEEALFPLSIECLVERCISVIDSQEKYLLLKKSQKKRKTELTFSWAEKISNIICEYDKIERSISDGK